MTMLHVALYCRRSVDRNDLAVSVAVQEKMGRRFAREQWPDLPVVAYVDNDISAADPAVTRPGYVKMVDAIRAGRVVQVVAREQSRLTRQPSEWEALCTTLQLAGIPAVHTVTAGAVSVAEGSRLPGRIMAVVDAEYVEQVKAKVRSTLAEHAAEGRPHGRPGYGYLATVGDDGRPTRTPDPVTAPIVARIVSEVAAGVSLGAVARGLNRDRIPTPHSAAQWRAGSVRSIVRSPRVAGLREHRGSIRPGTWPPIVDRATWERAQARLAGTRPGVRADKRRRYLLTGGLAVCGECGAALISSRQPMPGGSLPAYQCPHRSRPNGGCGKCSILADRLEEHVVEVVGGWLDDPVFVRNAAADLASGQEDAAPLRSERDRIEGQLADLAAQHATGGGGLLDVEYAAARRTLAARHADLSASLGEMRPVDVSMADLVEAWGEGSVGARRSVIAALCKPVRVGRAFVDGRRRSARERVVVRPR